MKWTIINELYHVQHITKKHNTKSNRSTVIDVSLQTVIYQSLYSNNSDYSLVCNGTNIALLYSYKQFWMTIKYQLLPTRTSQVHKCSEKFNPVKHHIINQWCECCTTVEKSKTNLEPLVGIQIVLGDSDSQRWFFIFKDDHYLPYMLPLFLVECDIL
jgi:hypothetical protein